MVQFFHGNLCTGIFRPRCQCLLPGFGLCFLNLSFYKSFSMSSCHQIFAEFIHLWGICVSVLALERMEHSAYTLLDERRYKKALMFISWLYIKVCLNLTLIINNLNIQIIHLLLRRTPHIFDGRMHFVNVIQKFVLHFLSIP